MNNLRLKGIGALVLSLAFFQFSPTCHGQAFDLLYSGGATGNFSTTGDWDSGFNPIFTELNDSVTFGATPAGGATVDNDLDPAANGGVPLQLGLGAGLAGAGARGDSASFHFLDGSGDFTITGFPVQLNATAANQLSAVRIEPTAGTTQTINNDLVFPPAFANPTERIIMLNSGAGGKLVLNGDIDYSNGGNWFYGDDNLDSAVLMEFNGVGTFNTVGNPNQASSAWASGANVLAGNMTRAQIIRINAGDQDRGTVEGANGTHLVFGNSQALGRGHTGSWETDDLDYVAMASTRVERFNNGYADNNTFSVKAGVDLSEYGIATIFGSNWNFNSEFDTSIGFIHQFWAREDLNAAMDNYPNPNHPLPFAQGRGIQPFGSVTVNGLGVLSVAAHGGIFPTQYDGAEQFDLRMPGTSGEVPGANGQMIINGQLYNSWNSPAAQVVFGTTATGGIEPGPKVPNSTNANLALFVKPGQLVGADGSLVNGCITASYGTLTLNGDSGSTWRGSELLALNGSTIVAGNDNAFGDADSIVSIQDDSTVDTGTSTIAQEFVDIDGTIRGNGTLTNPSNWSVEGGVQPGGESPTETDTLTFDFSAASAANSVTLESTSTASFVFRTAGTSSSTVAVLGTSGGTTVALNNNVVAFTDRTGGTAPTGTYVLIDGDANTTVTLGAGVTTTGLGAYPGSTLSVVGNDLVLNLVGGGTLTGDFDNSGTVDCDDVDFYSGNIGSPATGTNAQLNLNGDTTITVADANLHITTLVQANGQTGTLRGDLDCDGDVDVLQDAFILIGSLGTPSGASYTDGDIDFDGDVDVLQDAFILIGSLGMNNLP